MHVGAPINLLGSPRLSHCGHKIRRSLKQIMLGRRGLISNNLIRVQTAAALRDAKPLRIASIALQPVGRIDQKPHALRNG
jgi:hypothetical protein